jgi:hypothetical protein
MLHFGSKGDVSLQVKHLVDEAGVSFVSAKEESLLLCQDGTGVGLGACSKELRMDATVLTSGQENLRGVHVEIVLKEGGDFQIFLPYAYCILVQFPFFTDVGDPSGSGVSSWDFCCGW